MWEPPALEDHNGELEEYSVILYMDNQGDSQEYSTEDEFLVLEDLKPHTKYDVMVAASTREGLGPYSELLAVMTQEDGKVWVYSFL